MSKTLKTEGSEWASSELKTSRSEDQVSKALKTEVVMNVSRFQNLKLRRSSANGTLSLKIPNLVLFLQKSTRKYTVLTTLYNKPARVGKMSLSSCKKQCAVGNTPKVPFISQRSPFHDSLYKKPLNPEAKENNATQETQENISLCFITFFCLNLFTLCF